MWNQLNLSCRTIITKNTSFYIYLFIILVEYILIHFFCFNVKRNSKKVENDDPKQWDKRKKTNN